MPKIIWRIDKQVVSHWQCYTKKKRLVLWPHKKWARSVFLENHSVHLLLHSGLTAIFCFITFCFHIWKKIYQALNILVNLSFLPCQCTVKISLSNCTSKDVSIQPPLKVIKCLLQTLTVWYTRENINKLLAQSENVYIVNTQFQCNQLLNVCSYDIGEFCYYLLKISLAVDVHIC